MRPQAASRWCCQAHGRAQVEVGCSAESTASAGAAPNAESPTTAAPAADGNWVPVLAPEDLPKGVRKEVSVNGTAVLLFWYRNQIYAIAARSPAEGAYSEGFIKAKFTQDFGIVCPQTGSIFSLKDGSIVEWYPANPVLRSITPPSGALPVRPEALPCRHVDPVVARAQGCAYHHVGLQQDRIALGMIYKALLPGCCCDCVLCSSTNAQGEQSCVQIYPVKLTQDAIMVDVGSVASTLAATRGGADTSLENNNVFALQPSVYLEGSDRDETVSPAGLSTAVTLTAAITAFAVVATAGTATALYFEDYILLGGFWVLMIGAGGYFAFQFNASRK